MKRRLTALLTAALMVLTMTACGQTEERGTPTGTTVDRSKVSPSLPANETTPTTAVQDVEPIDPVPTGTKNIITGKYDMGDTTLTRPVAIMVANNDFLQDGEQVGVGSADMWMETETEGGITRLMAVFANTERVPDSIGPVRSARSPFFHVVKALGLGYVHAGGSYPALNKIAASNIADLDVNTGEAGNYSWRDNNYGHAYEYRLRTSGDKLTQYMNDEGYKTYSVTDFPWTFGTQTGTSATNISVKMSGAQQIGFEYDAASGVYYKTNGSSKTRHVDSSGVAITPTSVLVLYTDMFYESEETIDYYMQSGKGYVFSGGVMRRFHWTRDDNGFTMTEEDGTMLTLAEGKVYLCVASTSYESGLSY